MTRPRSCDYQAIQYISICCELISTASTMATPQPSSQPPSLFTLPFELHLAIHTYLPFLDRHTLRLTHYYFHNLIDPPTHAELLAAESWRFPYLACVGCTRLRPMTAFSPKMITKKKAPSGVQACTRFCIECGRRPLPGVHRYMLGSRWVEHGVPFARCVKCKQIAQGPEDMGVRMCLPCHTGV